ncbi:hypothetical protein HDU96_010304, partial [Phlyctochytrium bullatum]
MKRSSPAPGIIQLRQSRQTFELLSVEALRSIILYVQPNDLPTLAAVNRHLRRTVPVCVDFEAAKHHLEARHHALEQPSVKQVLQGWHFDHPLLFEHTVAAIARYGLSETKEVIGKFTWDQATIDDTSEDVRLRRVAAVRTVVRKRLWPNQQQQQEDAFKNLLVEAATTAAHLRSLDLLAELRERFPLEMAADFNSTPYRAFIFGCARVGFKEGLALIPANHPILSEQESDGSSFKLLDLAVASGNLECVKLLHEQGALVNGDILKLPFAKYHDDTCEINSDVLQFLLEHGAETETCINHRGLTPLDCVAEKGHVQVLNILLAHGASCEAYDRRGCTALYLAASNGHSECIHALLNAGANVNARAFDGKTPLMAANDGGHLDAARILREHGGFVYTTAPSALPPVYAAVNTNDTELLRSLVEDGADLSAPDYMSQPPLHYALGRGNTEAATILLEAGADPNLRCWGKRTALHYLPENCEGSEATELLARMLESGVDLNAKDLDGLTALHLSARFGSYDLMLQLLQTEGIDTTVIAYDGNSWGDIALESDAIYEWLEIDDHAAQLVDL